jgi:flagellar M-ring protein FliF
MSIIQQLTDIWNRLPMAGRIATVGSAVATIGLVGALVYYGSQPEYGVLFSDLKAEDAQTIVEKLKASGVAYNLTNNGTTIQVPHDKISELRLQVASAGVLSGGHVGFDLFDKTTFGATDFAQQVNYRRAIEGELAKTLEGMEEVEGARVHISPKKESVFTEKAEGAKASVMLRVKQGKELSNERTDSIVSLVASAVEGLDPSNVSVLDSRGRLLTAGGRAKSGAFSDAGAFHAQLEAKQKFEQETAARVIALLEPVIGENRVRADISADVDFSQVEQTEEKYNPQSQVVRSQQNSQETRNSPRQNTPLAVGARANDPTAPPPAGANTAPQQGNNLADQRASTTTNYEIDKTTKKTIGGGGRINRLTVSVVVDNKTVNGVDAARTPEEVKQIQDLVAAAVGTDQNRGDSVVVQTMAFDKPEALADNPKGFLENNKTLISSGMKYGALLLIAGLIFFFVIRPARKALQLAAASSEEQKLLTSAERKADETAEEAEKRLGEAIVSKQLEDNGLAEITPMMTVAELEARLIENNGENLGVDEEIERVEAIKKQVTEQTLREPEVVVSTLRGWLREA